MPLSKESAKGLVLRQQDQGGAEPPPLGSVGLAQLKDEVSFGLLPVGAVIPVMSQLAGTDVLPASGVAANGWMRCDGAAIPSGQTLSGTLPDLTSGRFLYGTSGSGVGVNPVAGGIGGATSVTLNSNNLPLHTHTMDHGHANTFGLTGTTTFASTAHGHTAGNLAARIVIASSGSPAIFNQRATGMSGWNYTHQGNVSGGNAPATPETAGTVVAGTTDASNSNASVGFGGAVTSMTGSTGNNTSTVTAFSILPSYVAAVYLIRVK